MKRALIATARRLVAPTDGDPSEADLRRAVSTAYYAMFHALAELCADEIVGAGAESRSSPEWVRVYRTLDHGRSRAALREMQGSMTPVDAHLEDFCVTLERRREHRVLADYDPAPSRLTREVVSFRIDEAETAIADIDAADPKQRRALAFACVLARRV